MSFNLLCAVMMMAESAEVLDGNSPNCLLSNWWHKDRKSYKLTFSKEKYCAACGRVISNGEWHVSMHYHIEEDCYVIDDSNTMPPPLVIYIATKFPVQMAWPNLFNKVPA